MEITADRYAKIWPVITEFFNKIDNKSRALQITTGRQSKLPPAPPRGWPGTAAFVDL